MKLLKIKSKKENICNKCGKNISASMIDFCNSCFIKIFERKFRKHLRQYGLVNKKVIVCDDVCEYFMENVMKAPVEIKRLRVVKKNGMIKEKLMNVCLPITMDDAIEDLLKFYFEGIKIKKDNKIIPLFEAFSNEEMGRYCEIRKLKWIKEENDINNLVSELDSHFKGTKHSLFSTLQELRKNKVI